MKIKIWPDDASMLQMNDWLAELRDDGRAEPPGAGGEMSVSDGTRPAAPPSAAPPSALPFRSAALPSAAPDRRLRPPRALRPPRLPCGL